MLMQRKSLCVDWWKSRRSTFLASSPRAKSLQTFRAEWKRLLRCTSFQTFVARIRSVHEKCCEKSLQTLSTFAPHKNRREHKTASEPTRRTTSSDNAFDPTLDAYTHTASTTTSMPNLERASTSSAAPAPSLFQQTLQAIEDSLHTSPINNRVRARLHTCKQRRLTLVVGYAPNCPSGT